jgi:hypothetical protein
VLAVSTPSAMHKVAVAVLALAPLVLFPAAPGAGLLGGCGRRATQADCQLIVDKAVELQMKDMSPTDASEVQRREQQVRAELEAEIKSCEGRHVTERTLACVKGATTTQGLDSCLR